MTQVCKLPPRGDANGLFGGTYADGWIGYTNGHLNPHPVCRGSAEYDIWEAGWLDARRAGAREVSPQWHQPMHIPTTIL